MRRGGARGARSDHREQCGGVNLALLIGHFPPGSVGGAEIQAEQWACRLAARHGVTVITRQDAADSDGRASAHAKGKPYVLHRLSVSRVPLLRTAVDVARIARAVASLTPRPDLLLCFQTFVSGFAGVRIQRATGIPAVVWIRGEEEYRLARSLSTRIVSPRVWTEARGVLVQSEANRATLLEELGRVAPGRVADVGARLAVVPNGIELPSVAPISDSRRVLAVGRLIADKGMDVVIEALAGTELELTIAGDGPERARLEPLAARTGALVRFEGNVSRARLDALYRDARCVVLASRRGEGMPNVLLEAMAQARPVVATPVAGVRDLVRDGINGTLVPVADVLALRAAIVRLTTDAAMAERLGTAGRATVEPFAWAEVEPKLEAALVRWSAA
jgi:glycogen synthase